MKISFFALFLFFVAPVFAQDQVVRDIKSFGAKGDGKTNDHEAFQRAAAFFNARGGNGRLVISKGVYLVGKQIFNQNTTKEAVYEGQDLLHFTNVKNLTIEGLNRPVIRYRSGLHFGSFVPATGEPSSNGGNFYNYAYAGTIRNAIELTNCQNIQIQNLELDGNSNGFVLGGSWGDVGRQLPHSGIWLADATNVTVTNVNVHHFGLDGMVVSNATGKSKTKDAILISNSKFEYNARQGLSWVGGNDLTAIKTSFSQTGKGKYMSSPGAGLDIEAEVGGVSNGKFLNCQFVNNSGCGMVAESGPSSDCTFTNCLFWGIDLWTAWIRKPRFHFDSCTFRGSIVHGFSADKDEDATTFTNCVFEDKPYNGKEVYGGFLIESNYAKRVRFTNCLMHTDKKKLAWVVAIDNAKPEEKYQFINCQFIYDGANLPVENNLAYFSGIRYQNCSFESRNPNAKGKKYFFMGLDSKNNFDLGGNKILLQ